MKKNSVIVSLFIQDMRFLHRQGLIYLYLLMTFLYTLALLLLPERWGVALFPILLFTDPAVMAFFFSAAMIFLESDQGTLSVLFVSSVTVREYLIARSLSLGSIALAVSLILSLVHLGFPREILSILLGVGLSSFLFTLLGILLSLYFESFTTFLILGGFLELPLIIPILSKIHIWDHPLLRIFPTDGILNLLYLSPLNPLTFPDFLISLVVIMVPLILLFPLTEKALQQYLVRRGL